MFLEASVQFLQAFDLNSGLKALLKRVVELISNLVEYVIGGMKNLLSKTSELFLQLQPILLANRILEALSSIIDSSIRSIAEVVGLSLGTVKTLLVIAVVFLGVVCFTFTMYRISEEYPTNLKSRILRRFKR